MTRINFTIEIFLRFTAKDMKYRTWKFAISKCIAWQGIQHDSSFKDFVYEDKGKSIEIRFALYFWFNFFFFNFLFLDPDIQVRCSIPGSLYLISSIALVLITKYLQNNT